MLSLYIHIPFCEVKCGYCDFYSVPRGWEEFDLQETYVATLCQEIDRRCKNDASPVQSIFFGGGTPSLLRADLLETILKKLSEHFTWDANTEITMETNPKTIDRAGLADRKTLGINRISLGVQSFQDPFLKRLGRIHSGKEARRTLEAAQSLGFDKISLDLMFALPGQSLADWQQDVETTMAFDVDHLSCYNLTIEPGTAFGEAYQVAGPVASKVPAHNGVVVRQTLPRTTRYTTPLPIENTTLSMFTWTREQLGSAGLAPYEISNFARPSHESVHNLNYWRYGEYIGFGVSASSFERATRRHFAIRQTNVRDLKSYLNADVEPTMDPIDRRTAMGEFVMLALRTQEGLSEQRFVEVFGEEFMDVFAETLSRVGGQFMASDSNRHWHLSNEGLRVADSVILEFIS